MKGLRTWGEQAVFRVIRRHPGISRAEVGAATRLSSAAVTQIVKRQLEAGWVVEVGPDETRSGPGRVPIGLEANSSRWRALGMVARRFDVAWALIDLSGRLDRHWQVEVKTAQDLPACAAVMRRIEEETRARGLEIVARGIGLPTFPLMWVKRQEVLALTDALWGGGRYAIGHNGSHAALAEEWLGQSVAQRFLYVFLGAGIGGAVVERLPRGQAPRVVLVEVGHVGIDPQGPVCACGNRGCVETTASPLALMQAGGLPNLDVLEAVPERAPERARQAVEALAYGLISIINILDVGDIVVGGHPFDTIARVYGTLPTLLQGRATPSGQPIRITISRLGPLAAAVGAALDAVDRGRWTTWGALNPAGAAGQTSTI